MKTEKEQVSRPASQGKKKKRMNAFAVVLLVITIILVLAVAALGFLVWRKYASITADQEEAASLYGVEAPADEEEPVSIPEVISSEPVNSDTGILDSFTQLHEVNPDIIGYVQIPGTKLNTAVAQGDDNVFYLDHNYKGQQASLGVPFVDYRATVSPERMSEVLTIYGHSARDGSYFAALQNYKNLDYYKEHPVVLFDTIYAKGAYKIIGLFMENVNYTQNPVGEMFEYHNIYDMNETEYNSYIDNVMRRSYFKTGVDVQYGDQLLALSTCDYDVNDKDFRVVLVARRVRNGETTAVDTSAATANTEMLMPKEWIAKYGKANPYQ